MKLPDPGVPHEVALAILTHEVNKTFDYLNGPENDLSAAEYLDVIAMTNSVIATIEFLERLIAKESI